MMHSVAIEGARHGILANALLPGARSRLGKASPGTLYPEWEADLAMSDKPGLSLISPSLVPEYVAPLVLYLCSECCTSTRAVVCGWGALCTRLHRRDQGLVRNRRAATNP